DEELAYALIVRARAYVVVDTWIVVAHGGVDRLHLGPSREQALGEARGRVGGRDAGSFGSREVDVELRRLCLGKERESDDRNQGERAGDNGRADPQGARRVLEGSIQKRRVGDVDGAGEGPEDTVPLVRSLPAEHQARQPGDDGERDEEGSQHGV